MAPGTMACVESVTRPTMEPESCACAKPAKRPANTPTPTVALSLGTVPRFPVPLIILRALSIASTSDCRGPGARGTIDSHCRTHTQGGFGQLQLRSVVALCTFVCVPPLLQAQRVITTIAGADWLFPGDGRPAINAPLSGALFGLDLAFDQKGNYYIADGDNLMIMRVGADGILSVVAGTGINFSSGDGGLAINACITTPVAIAVDRQGNLYIAEVANLIRKVTPDGIITTIAGDGEAGFSGDDGPAVDAEFNMIGGLAVDAAGNLFVADRGNHRIRKITPDGKIG